ncbi:MAG: amino acid permease [Nitrososphaerales archaeon]
MSSSEQTKAQPVQPKVFVRDSTGLVKNVSFFDSIALNLSNMSVGALLGVIGISGLLPMFFAGQSEVGLNLVALCLIAFVLSVPQIVIYTMMSRRYPRAGGDYVFVSRNLGGAMGSVASFVGYTTETTAYLALIVLSTVFAIGTVGLFFSSASSTYLGLATPSNAYPGAPALPLDQFILGACIFAILIAINVLKPKAGYKLVSVLTIVGIIALILAVGVLLGAGHSGVQNYINGVSGNGYFTNSSAPASTYNNMVAGSHTGGPGGSDGFAWAPTIFLLPLIAAFVFPWLNAAPAVASEIKGRGALKWNVPISAVLAFAFVTGSIGVMYATAGQAFTNAAYSTPAFVYGQPVAFNFWTLAMGVSNNSIIAGIIGLGWILANLGILAYGIIVISRYLLAQSFDRFLPSRLSTVSSRFGSPIVAHFVDLVMTVVLVGLAAYYYTTPGLGAGTNPLFGAILASMVYFMVVGLSAAVHAVKKEAGGAKVILAAAGILNIIVFGFLSYEFLANQTVWALNSITFTFIIGSLAAGILFFSASYWYNKKRGVDITLAYRELPPE